MSLVYSISFPCIDVTTVSATNAAQSHTPDATTRAYYLRNIGSIDVYVSHTTNAVGDGSVAEIWLDGGDEIMLVLPTSGTALSYIRSKAESSNGSLEIWELSPSTAFNL